MWNDKRPGMMNTISWFWDHWIKMFAFVLPLLEKSNCFRKWKNKLLIDRTACDFSWSSLHCFILQFVLWSGIWKGAEMDLIACAFRSDEMVHHTRWRVEVIMTISLPSFSSLFRNTGPYWSASEPCLFWSMMQVPQRSMEPWIPAQAHLKIQGK